ncbi:MAG: hypothetical protein NT040_13725 [Bacteroidetes bacterium]|nr:hypothetical protein [Bacteroidota bacterium]
MKKYNHPIDDLFSEALKDHQMAPRDEAKKAFLRDVIQAAPAEKKGRRGLILLSVLLALLSAGIVLWINASDKASSHPREKSTSTPHQLQFADKQTSNAGKSNTNTSGNSSKTNTTTNFSNKQPVRSQPGQQPLSIGIASQSQKTRNPGRATNHQNPPKAAPAASRQHENVQAQARESTETLTNTETAPVLNAVKPDTGSVPVVKRSDSVVNPAVPAKQHGSGKEAGKHSNRVPEIGVYYTPEWMFGTLEGTKFVNNFGLEGTFHFGRFSVRTGAGISVAKGTNELVVAYNDFLGTYNKLDSMNFTWNDPAHNYIPTMYTSKKDVWDSLMKLENARIVKRYTYLQIPMIMGYDFWQTERVSVGVRAGPILSLLLTSKQLSAAYDPGSKRIISINDIAPEQVSLNWQVMAGINTSIVLTRKLKFEIEPEVRYYFNSVYEKPVNNTKPWSIGVRAAFVVEL